MSDEPLFCVVCGKQDCSEHDPKESTGPYCYACGVIPAPDGACAFHSPDGNTTGCIPAKVAGDRLQGAGARVNADDDLIWCTECGRMLPWKHKRKPTLRARVANALVRVLTDLSTRIESWRDRDTRS